MTNVPPLMYVGSGVQAGHITGVWSNILCVRADCSSSSSKFMTVILLIIVKVKCVPPGHERRLTLETSSKMVVQVNVKVDCRNQKKNPAHVSPASSKSPA